MLSIRKLLTISILGFSILLGTSAVAGMQSPDSIFDHADSLFTQRGNNRPKIAEARAAYLALVTDDMPIENRVYAVQQVGWLAHYEGTYLIPSNRKKEIAAVFNECYELASTIGESLEYKTMNVFWALSCRSLWMQVATLSQQLAALKSMKHELGLIIDDDLEVHTHLNVDTRYMGGGVSRVLSGIFRTDQASMIRNTLPNKPFSLEMVARALSARPYPGTNMWGIEFYKNYTYKATSLISLGEDESAEELLEDIIEEVEERIEDEDLPESLEPETLGELEKMRDLLFQLKMKSIKNF
jgi:hypothetical protein